MTKKNIPQKRVLIKNFDGDNVPDDFELPSIGLEDIDRAVFNLFDKELQFEISSKGEVRSVPVIFSTGERFALTRRKKPLRDKNNANILPLISIVRQGIDTSPGQSGKGTAISFRAQPNYTIKRRLSDKDRSFQNLINKQGLKNQDNVKAKNNFVDVANELIAKEGHTTSRRKNTGYAFSPGAQINLKPQIDTNIYEIIQVPYPYFVALKYDITFWCQYMTQGNEMIEYLLTKLQVPGAEFSVKTDGGYELVIFMGESISFNNNFDSMSDDDRIIKYNFDMTVPGYILNTKTPGLPTQTRSFISAPFIDFTYNQVNSPVKVDYQPETNKETVTRHVLSDIANINELTVQRGEANEEIERFVNNPFANEGESEFLRIKNTNSRTGESIVSSRVVKKIDSQFE